MKWFACSYAYAACTALDKTLGTTLPKILISSTNPIFTSEARRKETLSNFHSKDKFT